MKIGKFDWGRLISTGLETAGDVYGSYTQKEITEIQADTLKSIQGATGAKTAGLAGGGGQFAGINTNMLLIGGLGIGALAVFALVIARK